MSNSLTDMSISELGPRIRNRSISPVEVTKAILDRIERLQPVLNSFITVLPEAAMASAREREQAIMHGHYLGPLDGIPFGVKDNIATAGIRTTVGSRVFDRHVPAEDAHVVARLKGTGAILVGKENLLEFASGDSGLEMSNNRFFGQARNPWNTEYFSGGSSSGSGPNVAARMTYFSLGTDMGGSARCPASLNGIVGFKQTFGRVSVRGLLMSSLIGDHICPLTRTVSDNALVLQVIAGHDALDPTTMPVPVPDYSASLGKPLAGLKAGVPKDFYFDIIDPEVDEAVRKAITDLEELGVEVSEVRLPMTAFAELAQIAGSADTFITHEPYLKAQRQDYSPVLANQYLAGQFLLAKDYAKSMRAQRLIREDFARALAGVDFLITPTQAIPAHRIKAESFTIGEQTVPMKEVVRYLSRNTFLTNLTGLPSLTVPCGLTRAGLPIGLQFIGKPFDEALLLQVASGYETVSPSLGKLAPV